MFNEGVNFTLAIDFSQSKTNDTVSVFETTIRYVGGMLSAYELGGKKDERLVQKAQELADRLTCGWAGDNDLPYNELNFTTNQPVIQNVSILQADTNPLLFILSFLAPDKYRYVMGCSTFANPELMLYC